MMSWMDLMVADKDMEDIFTEANEENEGENSFGIRWCRSCLANHRLQAGKPPAFGASRLFGRVRAEVGRRLAEGGSPSRAFELGDVSVDLGLQLADFIDGAFRKK